MGILNVTPDSFSDGGMYQDVDAALARTSEMIAEGARIVDVGGASSRPRGSAYGEGAAPVSVDEESARVVPVIREIVQRWPDVGISIDTWSADVAERALDAGAHIINDITALRGDSRMASVAGARHAPVILMHSVGLPGDMPHDSPISDPVQEVYSGLSRAVAKAEEAGCTQIVLDPGLGFGKSTEGNLTLVRHLDVLRSMGWPILVGASRKTFIGRVLGSEENPAPVAERIAGGLGVAAAAVGAGARIVRTHDVRETAHMLRLFRECQPVK